VVYPTGVVAHAGERVLVACCLVVGLLLLPAQALLVDPHAHGCDACPANPLVLTHSERVSHLADQLPQLPGAALSLALVVRLLVRFRKAAPNQRLGLAPVALAASIAATTFVVMVVVDFVAPGNSRVPDLATEIALILVPVGFAA